AEGSREAKTGAVVLAVRSGAPVLPVYVGKLPGPLARLRGGRHEIFVGEPLSLDVALRGSRAYKEAADEIMRAVYALPEAHARRTAKG
ncbi:MAG: lysophospholipid acyltransferase family protein, partial [Rubrobacter sp.]